MVGLGPLSRPLRSLRRQLPPLNFITIHYIYFITTCLISAVIFWGSSHPHQHVRFIDALYLTVSAMTLAGLNTVNLSELNTFQQVLLFVLIMLGSAIFVSAFVVQVRRKAFERKFKDVAEERQKRRQRRGRSSSRRRRFSFGHREGSDLEVSPRQEDDEMMMSGSDGVVKSTGNASGATSSTMLKDETIRDETPPARRGGPEMNGPSSSHGEVLPDERDDEATLRQSLGLNANQSITFSQDTRFEHSHVPATTSRRRQPFFSLNGVGARSTASIIPTTPLGPTSPGLERVSTRGTTQGEADLSKYIDSDGGWISRNSQFHGLTDREREQLGGYEYRAVSLLAWLVPAYFVLWQLFGAIGCAAWVATQRPDTARANGLNPWWVGAFNAVSAFNNSGMSLLDANMVAFQTGYYILITMALLIWAGNTCYPLFLRLIVWCLWKISICFDGESWTERAQTLRFLLDHPRRCYTNLFPSQHTWFLLLSVVTLNGIDWAAFEILNIGNRALDYLPTHIRVIDGLFQAAAVRSGGFYVVSIPTVRISLQVLYVVMMYISVYPVVITMRNSNVYEERSLGIYADDPDFEEQGAATDDPEKQQQGRASEQGGIFSRVSTFAGHVVRGGAPTRESNAHFVRQQLRAQLAHDAWIIVMALFLIMIIEGSKFNDNPKVFSVFNYLFEIVSAYGCVGISIGLPWAAYSFSGSWQTLSKLILCIVMIRGRHRGLPVAIDRAVLLPGEENWAAEEDDGRIRMARSLSRGRSETA